MISGEEVLELLPALAAREPTSGYLFYDCQTDDVRLVLTVLGEAERFGAVCANRVEVTGLLERDGRTRGVRALDAESGAEFEVRAANVVNATGVWADELRPQELHDEAELPRIRPSRGTHIILEPRGPAARRRRDRAGRGGALDLRAALARAHARRHDRQRLRGRARARAARPREDVDYLLEAVNEFFGAALGAGDLAGAYAGVRPLISTGDPKKSVDISRKAELYETSSGMITITGGKLTTWRRMAKMAVDRLVERDAREAPCRTHEIPLGQAIAVGGAAARGGRAGGVLRGAGRALRRRRARGAGARGRAPASWPSRSSPACPTCSPRSCSRPAASRRAASATCSCAARASGCSPRAS